MDQQDQARFENLYRENVRRLLAYVLTRTTTERAHDVIASAFLVAWRRFDEVPPDALPWLIGVARRVLADQRRSDVRQRAVGQRLAHEATTSQTMFDGAEDSIVLRRSIRDALAQMREQDREIVILIAWHDFNIDQLAVALSCSKAVASLRLHRARKRFAKYFDSQEGHSKHVGSQVIRPAKEVP